LGPAIGVGVAHQGLGVVVRARNMPNSACRG
jgi:hypothetical protein